MILVLTIKADQLACATMDIRHSSMDGVMILKNSIF